MSFGYSIGDFITIIRIAKDLHRRFREVPQQFSDIAKDLDSLRVLLQETYQKLPDHDTTPSQEQSLISIVGGCRSVFDELNGLLDKSNVNDQDSSRVRTWWKRVRWDKDKIGDFRQRLGLHVDILSTFLTHLNT